MPSTETIALDVGGSHADIFLVSERSADLSLDFMDAVYDDVSPIIKTLPHLVDRRLDETQVYLTYLEWFRMWEGA